MRCFKYSIFFNFHNSLQSKSDYSYSVDKTEAKKGHVALRPWGSGGAGLLSQLSATKPVWFAAFQQCPDLGVSWSRSISKQTVGVGRGDLYRRCRLCGHSKNHNRQNSHLLSLPWRKSKMLTLETRENHVTDYKSENSYWNKNDLVLSFLTIADTSENCHGQVQCFRTTSPLLGHPGAILNTYPLSSSTHTCIHVSRFVTRGISPASYLSTHLSSPKKQSGTGLCILFFFKIIFSMWTIFFFFWFYWLQGMQSLQGLQGMWDLRVWTCIPTIRRQNLYHWTARKVPLFIDS